MKRVLLLAATMAWKSATDPARYPPHIEMLHFSFALILLVATSVLIEYEPDSSLVTVSPAGPSRLQTDALTGLDERYLAQLLALAGPAGTLEVDLGNDLERRELFERALGRLG